ncbi:MAG: 3-keto-disaccharide hydrolase [Bryobacteraceae bacterium]
MQRTSLLLLLTALAATLVRSKDSGQPFTGRWDLTVVTPQGTYPSWMEMVKKDGTPEVHIVGRVASVHPVTGLKLDGSRMTFSTTEWFGKEIQVDWDILAKSGKLTGSQKREDGVQGKLTGVPAPALDHKMPLIWNDPVPLFNGKDLTGWEPLVTEQGKPPENRWKAENGELVNQAAGANIRTTRKFQDFKLHIEYNCPPDGNSGVYLRGRYEVQVEYEPAGHNDKFHGMGSIYGFIAPAQAVSARPGQWESYDVTLAGRKVTVVRDDVTIIDNQEIPGITGGALDSHEAEPGPIYIQGDHTGGMKYRKIMISTPKGQ